MKNSIKSINKWIMGEILVFFYTYKESVFIIALAFFLAFIH
jgi:hypothetical protein